MSKWAGKGEAIEAFERVLELDPGDAEAREKITSLQGKSIQNGLP